MVQKEESMDFKLELDTLCDEDVATKTEYKSDDSEKTMSPDGSPQEMIPDPYSGDHSYLVQDIKMDIELESEEPQPLLVVYTTRLERMGFLYTPVTKDNQSLIIKSIIKESKPKLKSLHNTDKSNSRSLKYYKKKLKFKINEFNKVVRERDPTPTKEVINHVTRTAAVLLNYCKPFTIDLDEIPEKRNEWVHFKLSRLRSIKDQIKKFLDMSRRVMKTYFFLKNEHTEITDIYLLKKNNQVSEYYRIDNNKHLPIQNAHQITIVYCCWFDKELKLKLFFNSLQLSVPKYFRKPHTCTGCCKCCCSHHSRVCNISPQQEEYRQPNDKMNSQKDRISYLIDKSPNETADMSVINKALRFFPKISRKITPDAKAKDITPPINIHLKDNKTNECSYYRIGEYGQLETYLKPYSSQWNTPFDMPGDVTNQDEANDPLQIEDVSQQENDKNTETGEELDQTEIKYNETLLCWFTRQNVLNKLFLEHVPESIINFFKIPHSCSPGNCDCCCKSPNTENNKLHMMVNLPEVPIYTTRMYTILNISLQFSNVLTIPVFRPTLMAINESKIMNKPTSKNEPKAQYFTRLKAKGESNQSVKEIVDRSNTSFADYVDLTDDINTTNANTSGNSELSGHALSTSYNLPSTSNHTLANSTNSATSPSSEVFSISSNKSITNNMQQTLIHQRLTKFKDVTSSNDQGNSTVTNNTANTWSSEVLENIIRLAQKEIDTLQLNPTQNSVDTTTELPILVQKPRRSKKTSKKNLPNGTDMPMTSNKVKKAEDVEIYKSLYENNKSLETKKIYELFTKMTYKNNTHCLRSYDRESENMTRRERFTHVAADSRHSVDATLTPVRTLNPTMKMNTDESLGKVVRPKGGEIILTKDSRSQWKLGNPSRTKPKSKIKSCRTVGTFRPLQEAANPENKSSAMNVECDLNKDYDLEDFLASTTIVKRKRTADIEVDTKIPRKVTPKALKDDPLLKVGMDPTSMKNGPLLVKTGSDNIQPVTTADIFYNGNVLPTGFHMAYVPVLNTPNGLVVPNVIVPQIVANHNSTGQLSDAFRFDLPGAVQKKSSMLEDLLAQPQREVSSVSIGPSKIRPKPLQSLLKSSGMPSEQYQTVIVDDEDSVESVIGS